MEQRHDRAFIRKMAKKKARRKQWIVKHCYGWDYYDNLHQYSKNKIHCSCPLCRAKRMGNRMNYLSIAEQKKIFAMEEQLFDFESPTAIYIYK